MANLLAERLEKASVVRFVIVAVEFGAQGSGPSEEKHVQNMLYRYRTQPKGTFKMSTPTLHPKIRLKGKRKLYIGHSFFKTTLQSWFVYDFVIFV